MAKLKGTPKTPGSGRKKGTTNAKTKLVEETAKRLGIDPFEVTLLFAKGDWSSLGYENECYFSENASGSTKLNYVISPDLRAKCAMDACKYLYSQKRDVEISNKDGEGFKVILCDYSSKENK